jgi:hypothetical protein
MAGIDAGAMRCRSAVSGVSLAVALALALAACATPAAHVAQARQTWQGAAYEDVVRAWGVPARGTTLAEGREARTWVSEVNRSRGVLYPSVGVFGGSGNVGVGVGVGASTPFGQEIERCERTLVFAGDRVVEAGPWTGPETYCASFGR